MERFIVYLKKKAFDDETMALHEEATPHQNYHCMTTGWQPGCSESFFLSIRQAIAEMNTFVFWLYQLVVVPTLLACR